MSQPIHRPLSIWITQVLLVMTLMNGIFIEGFMIFSCSSIASLNCIWPAIISTLLIYLPILTIIFLAFWGLQKRRRYGKWLAVSLLVGSMVVTLTKSHSLQLIYYSITQGQPLPAPPYECWEEEPGNIFKYSCGYESYRELILRIISDILPILIPGLLAVRLVYGGSVKRFFQK